MAVEGRRNRYIAFRIAGGKTDRSGMIGAIRRAFSRSEYEKIKPWLTVFEGGRGIVRINHDGKERALEILNSIEVGGGKVETLTT